MLPLVPGEGRGGGGREHCILPRAVPSGSRLVGTALPASLTPALSRREREQDAAG